MARVFVPYKRKQKGRTDYKKRLKLVLSKKPRIVIRKSLKSMNVQLVQYTEKGDKVLLCASSHDIEKMGWKYRSNSIPACYLIGILFGKKMKQAKQEDGVVDIWFYPSTKGSRLYGTIKGIIDAGIEVNAKDVMFPRQERLEGKHIAAIAKKNPNNFSRYNKENLKADDLPKQVEALKKKILENG
ncbi:50S ribosomal protein L18 [Candidatus Woesearchaeota archaeon]|nr:large subunit ribosomal protein L18 [uncultured archaeon]KHO47206.1 MAG: large subunit ribosomal protein L18 [archaeon GW2011_AR4]MBS3129173.1 50S ribosomal protein L18 [Candidatus Woesearchaeota archaeon]HIH37906.1 50S ribosomal protein L18 [Candidatus Woesearchaeota archaeon]HIH48885.1 50S ribosomal protein L18 [Candidatus Woesearchaeota archaeon]